MSGARVIGELRQLLADAGLRGSFLVRDLSTGEEIGIDADTEFPIASLVKLPLAIAVLSRISSGRIDGSAMVDVAPGQVTSSGPQGLGRFRHPARIAVDDLLYLSVAVSDNTAADAPFDLVPPAEVDRVLRETDISGIAVRHRMHELTETPARRFSPGETHLAHSLAIGSRTAGGGHPVPQLDISRANSKSARAFTELLHALWIPARIPVGVAAQARALLGENLLRHRLAPDFSSGASKWSSKTGTVRWGGKLPGDVGAVIGSRADERQAIIQLKVQAPVGQVLSGAAAVALLTATAVKAPLWPFAILVGLVGVSAVAGWVIYRDRGDGRDEEPGRT